MNRYSQYALAIAYTANAMRGMLDKQGQPMIEHALRVALTLKDLDEKIVAVLHDVIEDCEKVTLVDLSFIFPSDIVSAVDAISKRNNESYIEFIKRCCLNDIARRVKKEDIMDNNSSIRLYKLDPNKRMQLRLKYAKALNYINNYNK